MERALCDAVAYWAITWTRDGVDRRGYSRGRYHSRGWAGSNGGRSLAGGHDEWLQYLVHRWSRNWKQPLYMCCSVAIGHWRNGGSLRLVLLRSAMMMTGWPWHRFRIESRKNGKGIWGFRITSLLLEAVIQTEIRFKGCSLIGDLETPNEFVVALHGGVGFVMLRKQLRTRRIAVRFRGGVELCIVCYAHACVCMRMRTCTGFRDCACIRA